MYGIEKASRYYFSKPAGKLTLGESALLAAIPNNPELYNPLTKLNNTQKRQKWILDKMKEQKFIDEELHGAAVKQPIKINVSQQVAPFPEVVGYVKEELLSLLAGAPSNKGLTADALVRKRDELLRSGVVVETSLDSRLQKEALQAVNSRLPFKGVEGSAVVVDHASKQIVAMIGERMSG